MKCALLFLFCHLSHPHHYHHYHHYHPHHVVVRYHTKTVVKVVERVVTKPEKPLVAKPNPFPGVGALRK